MDSIPINLTSKNNVTIDLNTNALPKSFISALIGKPGSGKTSYIRTILTNPHLYLAKYDYVYIVSPSTCEYKDICDEKQLITTLNINWIAEKINNINTNDKDKNINVLFILDDVISQVKDAVKDETFISFFLNRRHILWNGNVSIILTSQKYTMIPAKLRSSINWIVMFKMNPLDLEIIRTEAVFNLTKKEWNMAFKSMFEKEYGFVQFDVDNQILFHKFLEIRNGACKTGFISNPADNISINQNIKH